MKHLVVRRMASVIAAGIALAVAGAAGGYWWARQGAGERSAPAAATADPASSGSPSPGRKVLYWYDPMTPTQKFDKPGKSPFMDMQLVPRYADEVDSGEKGLAVSTSAVQTLGLRLAKVERTSLSTTVDAIGTIQFSERDVIVVQARTGGFVERVYARAPGDVIAAGSPLADVLNPEWAAAQREFLAVLGMHDPTLTQAARDRLQLLGMPGALIGKVEKQARVVPVTTITSPGPGVIAELAVRQGMTLSPGMTLARINGLSTVWMELALPEAQAGTLSVGQVVDALLAALPDRRFSGKVAAILPETNRDTRTLRVRVELPNPDHLLRAGMSAQAILHGPTREVLAVPAEAVIRTGKRALVYLSTGPGQYQPVEVGIGAERDGLLEVRSGLSAGQQVVASGQFLLDSEASLRGVTTRSGDTMPEHRTTGAPTQDTRP